jgi:phosphoribosylamine---glycine ligase
LKNNPVHRENAVKKNNTVVVIDSGGRGAALVDKYSQSPHVSEIIAVPGNDLMRETSRKPVETYSKLKTTSVKEIVALCKEKKVALVDVSQDNAIAVGLVDALEQSNIQVVGPTKHAGELEWNKAFAREFMKRYHISHPSFKVCHSQEEGVSYIKAQPDQPWFVKASGLAEGKGALPAENNAEAIKGIVQMRQLGDSGETFLLEEWLRDPNGKTWEEFSTFIFSDGKNFQIIGSAQDHKRACNFDVGENTGGMGCSSPPLVLTSSIMKKVGDVFQKTIIGLLKEQRPYKGVLYLGGMLVEQEGRQEPYVIEFNARWGDPEAEVILPGITTDLFEVSMAIVEGKIDNLNIKTDGKARVSVVGAARGYPQDYSSVKGKQIFGLEKARGIPGVIIYGAGVKAVNGKYYAQGGRLFHVVGEGATVLEAREKAYHAMSLITIEGNNLHYRTDIGWRDMQRLIKLQSV